MDNYFIIKFADPTMKIKSEPLNEDELISYCERIVKWGFEPKNILIKEYTKGNYGLLRELTWEDHLKINEIDINILSNTIINSLPGLNKMVIEELQVLRNDWQALLKFKDHQKFHIRIKKLS